MDLERLSQITVRDAVEADLPYLVAIKGPGSEALHRDRLRDAQDSSFRYLVLLAGQAQIGSGCLVFKRPAYWSDAADTQHLPQIVDLKVREDQCGLGYGTVFISYLERMAAEAGYGQLYLTVEPRHNPRAYALYLRLGYKPLQSELYLKAWKFTDSGGLFHRGEDWLVDMEKPLKEA